MLIEQKEGIQQDIQEEDYFEQEIKVTSAGRVYPKCSICGKNSSKYKCPGCQELTCSAYCSRKHKKRTGCSGTRSNTDYIPRHDYQELDSKRDYEYLISMIDNIDKVKKGLTGVYSYPHDQKSFKLLKKYGKQMYQIDLKVGPYIVEKHRENISFFFVKTNEFYWVFELFYLMPDGEIEKFVTDPTCDHLPISDLLKEDRVSTTMLAKFQINTSRLSEFKVLIKNQYRYGFLSPDSHAVDKKDFTYIEVDTKQQIKDIVKGLTIYEYPSIYLIHQSLIEDFCVKNKTHLL